MSEADNDDDDDVVSHQIMMRTHSLVMTIADADV